MAKEEGGKSLFCELKIWNKRKGRRGVGIETTEHRDAWLQNLVAKMKQGEDRKKEEEEAGE